MPPEPKSKLRGLEGMFFLSRKSPEQTGVNWQGIVNKEVAPGFYLVETFSWIMGERFCHHIVSVEKMAANEWYFFDDEEQWKYIADRKSSGKETEW